MFVDSCSIAQKRHIWHAVWENKWAHFYQYDVYHPKDIESLGEQDKINTSSASNCYLLNISFIREIRKINKCLNKWSKDNSQLRRNSLGLCFRICHLPNIDTVFRVFYFTFFIHVWWCYCNSRAVVTEGKWCNTGWVTVELTQSFLIERIPDIHKSIRATYI